MKVTKYFGNIRFISITGTLAKFMLALTPYFFIDDV